MDQLREEVFVSLHDFVIDDVMDSLGFNGEDVGMDRGNLLIAADRVYASEGMAPESRHRLVESLRKNAETLEDIQWAEGQRASFMLGNFIGTIALLESQERFRLRHLGLIDRSLQNIHISQDRYGYGDKEKFYDAFAFLTERSHGTIDSRDYRYMRKLCRYAEVRKNEKLPFFRSTEKAERVRSPWLPHLINGLAMIAMVQGYRIQPPENQQDENGAWQLPDETIHPDETDEI